MNEFLREKLEKKIKCKEVLERFNIYECGLLFKDREREDEMKLYEIATIGFQENNKIEEDEEVVLLNYKNNNDNINNFESLTISDLKNKDLYIIVPDYDTKIDELIIKEFVNKDEIFSFFEWRKEAYEEIEEWESMDDNNNNNSNNSDDVSIYYFIFEEYALGKDLYPQFSNFVEEMNTITFISFGLGSDIVHSTLDKYNYLTREEYKIVNIKKKGFLSHVSVLPSCNIDSWNNKIVKFFGGESILFLSKEHDYLYKQQKEIIDDTTIKYI
eukprot:TRINITY_DN13665_c0_g1_i1.p1 TRINITY_DN13665_c0_g1~~TRINITY_DN13665_c0_g1_i1.p1  ORF type:complete len:271 (+),score=81.76 TRINITY_DN13665_c0_g1_i1:153-965(+)